MVTFSTEGPIRYDIDVSGGTPTFRIVTAESAAMA
jgi:hypothetical protein